MQPNASQPVVQAASTSVQIEKQPPCRQISLPGQASSEVQGGGPLGVIGKQMGRQVPSPSQAPSNDAPVHGVPYAADCDDESPHVPFEQTGRRHGFSGTQTLPQAPQLFTLVSKSMKRPGQHVWKSKQVPPSASQMAWSSKPMQTPCEQETRRQGSSGGQARPQPPQWLRSVLKSMVAGSRQVPPQQVNPLAHSESDAQLVRQAPSPHT